MSLDSHWSTIQDPGHRVSDGRSGSLRRGTTEMPERPDMDVKNTCWAWCKHTDETRGPTLTDASRTSSPRRGPVEIEADIPKLTWASEPRSPNRHPPHPARRPKSQAHPTGPSHHRQLGQGQGLLCRLPHPLQAKNQLCLRNAAPLLRRLHQRVPWAAPISRAMGELDSPGTPLPTWATPPAGVLGLYTVIVNRLGGGCDWAHSPPWTNASRRATPSRP